MENREFEEEIRRIIAPLLENESTELVELSFIKAPERPILRLLVDKIGARISLGECARLNRLIGDMLDTSDTLKDRYVLEVSSPGLDRPLTAKNDFLRCLNKQAHFFFKEKISGKMELEGTIAQVAEDVITVNTGEEEIKVPLSNILKAKQII